MLLGDFRGVGVEDIIAIAAADSVPLYLQRNEVGVGYTLKTGQDNPFVLLFGDELDNPPNARNQVVSFRW